MNRDAPTVSFAEQTACVRREIAMRERVYPKWVGTGRMKAEAAEREIAAMRAVLQTLLSLQTP
jgi:hypothetical protein